MPGDRALVRGARALEELGHRVEDARRVAPRRGRLADGEADLALGPGEAGDRVEEEHHVLALVAEVLGDGRRDVGAAQARKGRRIRGRHDDDRAREALLAEVVLDELPHLAAALADEGDDVDVRVGVAGDHAHDRGLADARAREDADALAAPKGDEAVDGPHAGDDAPRYALAGERVGRPRDGGVGRLEAMSPLPSRGPAHAVEDAAQQAVGDGHLEELAGGDDLAADLDALEALVGHELHGVLAQAHDLGIGGLAQPRHDDLADLADDGLGPAALDEEAEDLGHPADVFDGVRALDGVEVFGKPFHISPGPFREP